MKRLSPILYEQNLRNDPIYSGLVRYDSEQHPTSSVNV